MRRARRIGAAEIESAAARAENEAETTGEEMESMKPI